MIIIGFYGTEKLYKKTGRKCNFPPGESGANRETKNLKLVATLIMLVSEKFFIYYLLFYEINNVKKSFKPSKYSFFI